MLNNYLSKNNDILNDMDFGALVISLDFELQWGVRDIYAASGSYQLNVLGARKAIPRILDIFEEFDIAATWATVGFLFAESREELRRFSPTTKPEYVKSALSPYQEPIGKSEKDDVLHFAPSLIRTIAQRTGQEIGTHTFSHYFCLEPGQTRAAFKADLESAVAIANHNQLQLRSIVLPRNQLNPNYADLLIAAGITCYRGNEKGWMYKPSTIKSNQHLLFRGARYLDRYLNISGLNLLDWDDIIQPNGLCNIASSRFLRPCIPGWQVLNNLHRTRIVQGIQAAAHSKKIFHLWWHPHNFGVFIDENIAFLRSILEAFDRARDRYGMRSMTMAEVVMAAKARQKVLSVALEKGKVPEQQTCNLEIL